MTTAVLAAPTVPDALERIEALLDLGNLRMKLADPHEGRGYTPEHLDMMEGEYRRFLALHLAFSDADIVPCKLVDEMWHQHILDTRAYHEDCEAIFGDYLHHFPYFGMRGEDEARALNDAYAQTLERYRDAFGEPPQGHLDQRRGKPVQAHGLQAPEVQMTDISTDHIQLRDDQRRLLRALEHAGRSQAAGAWFEQHDNTARQLGVAEDVLIASDREVVRSLNHGGLLRFDRTKAPKWVFTLDPRAAEFTV